MRDEHVRNGCAVGRDDRTLFIAVCVEIGVLASEALRPRLFDRDDGEAIAAIALDRDDDPVISEPDRAAGLDNAPRRPTGGRHDTHPAAVGVGDHAAVW